MVKEVHLFCGVEGTSVDVSRLVAESQVAKLVAPPEDMVTNCSVDDGGQHNARPDGQIIREDAQLVILVVDPTP
jgi:hypothetical protein